MTTKPNPAAPATAQDPAEELLLLRELLAQQQSVQHAQQRAIAQQALDEKIRRAQAEAQSEEAQRLAATPAAAQGVARPRESRRASRAAPRTKPTAIVSGETVDRAAIGLMRYGAIALLIVSFVGSIAAVNGGWDPVIKAWPQPWEGVNPLAAGVGFGLQWWITMIEWHKRHHKLSLLYIFHLAIDTILSFLGFYPLIGPLFASGLAKMGLEQGAANLAAGAIVAVLSVVLAMLPEQMLVED